MICIHMFAHGRFSRAYFLAMLGQKCLLRHLSAWKGHHIAYWSTITYYSKRNILVTLSGVNKESTVKMSESEKAIVTCSNIHTFHLNSSAKRGEQCQRTVEIGKLVPFEVGTYGRVNVMEVTNMSFIAVFYMCFNSSLSSGR